MNLLERANKLGVSTVLALVALCLAAVPSMADEPDGNSVSFSNDGRSFTDHPGSIFDGPVRLVPGDRLAGGIWIRNDQSSKVEMAVTPKRPEVESAMEFTTIGESRFQLAPQEKAWVALQVELPEDAGNSSADRTEQLQLQVRSSELSAEGEANPQAPDHLSDAGFNSWPLIMGLALTAAGMISLKVCCRTHGDNSSGRGNSE